MQIVILGAGVVGFQIASHLVAEGKDVVLIDNDPERAKYVSNHLDCIVLNEEGNNIVTLKRAGIAKADFFISVTNSDEVNMIACGLVASEFSAPIKIARVRNLDYSNSKILEKTFLGIDYIVNSEVETSRLIANTVALGATSDVMLFEDSDMQMRNIMVEDNSFFKDKSLIDIRKDVKEQFLVAGILRDDEFLIPSGNTIVRKSDNVYLLATKDSLTKIFMEVGRKSEKIERVVIVGGGKIGNLVSQYLIRTGRKITIIDDNYDNCKRLSEKFGEALVLHADISEEDIFEEEQLDKYDLIITATNNQELNVLTAVYAKSLGTKRSVALVAKTNYLPIATQLGIDATISPKNSTVDAILKFVRRGNIKSVHTLFGGKAEVIEFSVEATNKLCNKEIKDVEMPEDSLILSILRDNKNYIPGGNFVIEEGDSIIIITHKDSVTKIEDMFLE
ncbi:MAG: Trk system potassium transporter TrkA [bacterium]|nr:Trk system potassium transporter TrkA [bacterium]